jgi:TusA-related sulfurtransferase
VSRPRRHGGGRADGPEDGTGAAAGAVDAGDLPLAGGLLAVVRPALDRLEPGGVLAVVTSSRSAREDLPSWCRAERHVHLGAQALPDGREVHRIQRGALGAPRGAPEDAMRLPRRKGRVTAADVLAAVPFPERADPSSGFAPRGARVEPGGPDYPFTILDRDHAGPPEVARLYDQAVGATWDASRDVPWSKVGTLPAPLERAVGQVMTFLAENELAALYVPARFLPRIHPAYVETAMFLATQIADEARHIDVFLKRARAGGGGLGVSSATTSRSLLALMQVEDFVEAEFLLSVLGEGTFLDLLRFVEDHAPDEATAVLVSRARADETRHVHFGLAHVRHALATDPGVYGRLEAAVRRRAATLHDAGGVPHPLQDALTVLAARGTEPRRIARGHEAFRELLHVMGENRVKRLVHAGLSPVQAKTLSDLHTPNFM